MAAASSNARRRSSACKASASRKCARDARPGPRAGNWDRRDLHDQPDRHERHGLDHSGLQPDGCPGTGSRARTRRHARRGGLRHSLSRRRAASNFAVRNRRPLVGFEFAVEVQRRMGGPTWVVTRQSLTAPGRLAIAVARASRVAPSVRDCQPGVEVDGSSTSLIAGCTVVGCLAVAVRRDSIPQSEIAATSARTKSGDGTERLPACQLVDGAPGNAATTRATSDPQNSPVKAADVALSIHQIH